MNQKDGGRGQERKWTVMCPKEGLHTFRATECSDAETPAGHPRGRTNCRFPSYLSSQWLQADPACCTAKSILHHHTQPCTGIQIQKLYLGNQKQTCFDRHCEMISLDWRKLLYQLLPSLWLKERERGSSTNSMLSASTTETDPECLFFKKTNVLKKIVVAVFSHKNRSNPHQSFKMQTNLSNKHIFFIMLSFFYICPMCNILIKLISAPDCAVLYFVADKTVQQPEPKTTSDITSYVKTN